ncbi:FNIP repeat-containing protein [Heterostelium album PN500]|uniref:FNIP repeat-containing protein n=1 Tax=Heterostelium pallidum (strain ATCC 26659 / Pp 5 / PN500) TaxID=670386 RepID=D3BS27_HETP5|nr:FNIP repeat-containing protein [Heterostelium album PN500]EFA75764.1 FNIP repeat-containing protein [Heterostelium album PN500]|eukprot:XP_020427898.1 FNIP repeat-containing protein [Heterostelium album PN500]
MNNQTDKIVNLSHLILNKIISYLDDNIDIICFSLVCKRWYKDRDKYLLFNTDSIDLFSLNTTDINQNHKHFNLPSYQNTFMKSVQSKTDCLLVIGYKTYHNYDYHFDDARNLKSIPSNVSVVSLDTDIVIQQNQEYLYRLLSESQSVTMLKGCRTLKYGLPKSIKSIEFHNFNEPLVQGSLPNSLEVLDFGRGFKQEILPGVLPNALRTLTLNNYDYEIQPGVLPVGLLEFSLNFYNFLLKPGVLPVGLLKCYLYSYNFEIIPGVLPQGLLNFSLESSNGYQYQMQPGVFPSSIEFLSFENYSQPNQEDLQYSAESCLPISWLQEISTLPNLQSLFIYFPYQEGDGNTIFNVNYLPPTIKSFDFIVPRTILRGTMPTSLKKFYFEDYTFKDEIFPETSQYHLELLEYENKIIHAIPSNIKINEIIVRGNSKEQKITIPSGVGKIKFYIDWSNSNGKIMDFDDNGATNDQSCSLRELCVFSFKDRPKVNLPNTIELLDLGWSDLNETLDLVPSSVRTLVYKYQSHINITIPNTVKTITNIIGNFGFNHKQTIRKLDDNYYLLYGYYENKGNSGNLITRIFHHSKLVEILSTKIQ